jgi:hypothetical protein
VIAHQQIGIVRHGQTRQQFTEPDRVDFSRSTAGLGQALQGRFLQQFEKGHLWTHFFN